MKKAIDILSIISVISVLAMSILYLSTRNSDLYIQFIVDWFLVPLGFLVIPLLGWTFSLFYNRNKLPPKVWLSIYTVIFILLIPTVGFGYIEQTRDLSAAFRKSPVSIEGEVQNLSRTKSGQEFSISNHEFSLNRDNFIEVSRNKVYRIFYLQNSKYIVNIIDETGNSLLKK